MENVENNDSDFWLARTELLIGQERLKRLQKANVLVVGLGGVGAYAAEHLCRSGIGRLTIVDGDKISTSNRNRQLPALLSTVGREKSDVMAQRLKDINPELELTVINHFVADDEMEQLLQSKTWDYVVDAIDTVSPKINLIKYCYEHQVRIISSMGSGGKLDPTQVHISDIEQSHMCSLARTLRKRLHRIGIRSGIKVVFSTEQTPESAVQLTFGERNKKSTVGTISYMPAIFGCFCAAAVVTDLLEDVE